jgi:hypothetical protein
MFIWEAELNFYFEQAVSRARGDGGGDELIFSFNFGAFTDDRRGFAGPRSDGSRHASCGDCDCSRR